MMDFPPDKKLKTFADIFGQEGTQLEKVSSSENIKTKTDPLDFEIIHELAKVVFIRTQLRIQEGGSRVKETGNSDSESTWNEIKNDELSKVYALINSMWEIDEEEIFKKVYCKD